MDFTDIPVFYFALIPLLVFGPVFAWLLYNFGLRELIKLPREIQETRHREAERLAARRRRKPARFSVLGQGPRQITPMGWVAQALTYALFAAVIGYFSAAPTYTAFPEGMAAIKLSLSHVGKRKVECRQRTREELAQLARNMRAPLACPRERWPVLVELDLDGAPVFRESAAPAGLKSDGPSSFYRTFRVAAGGHRLNVRMRVRGDAEGFDYQGDADIILQGGQSFVVGFDSGARGFVFK